MPIKWHIFHIDKQVRWLTFRARNYFKHYEIPNQRRLTPLGRARTHTHTALVILCLLNAYIVRFWRNRVFEARKPN